MIRRDEMQSKKIQIGIGLLLITATASAQWVPIQLDRFAHGQVVQDHALGPATTKAVNFHHADGQLVAFDTRQRGTRDPDLQGPNGEDGQWRIGNLAGDEVLGTVLIVQSFSGLNHLAKRFRRRRTLCLWHAARRRRTHHHTGPPRYRLQFCDA